MRLVSNVVVSRSTVMMSVGGGPVAGSERRRWKRCEEHREKIKALEKIIREAQGKIDDIDRNIVEASRQPPVVESDEQEKQMHKKHKTEEQLTRLSNAWCESMRSFICDQRDLGHAAVEFKVDDNHPFDPQVSWELITEMGVKTFNYNHDTSIIRFSF